MAEIGFLDRTWPEGMYEIELVADGDSHLCSFRLPQQDEASIHPLSVRCEGDSEKLDATLTQKTSCKKERVGTTLMEACAPQTAEYTLVIELRATPNKLQLRATRDAELLTEQLQTLEYATYRPNGGACKPVCTQSSTTLLLDDAE